MSDQSPEFRTQEIKARRLEIIATLARWKSDYFNNGVERPLKDRARLESELADLDLEQLRIDVSAKKARAARREQINASLLTQLLAVMEERGLSDVLEEAQRRSSSMSEAIAKTESA